MAGGSKEQKSSGSFDSKSRKKKSTTTSETWKRRQRDELIKRVAEFKTSGEISDAPLDETNPLQSSAKKAKSQHVPAPSSTHTAAPSSEAFEPLSQREETCQDIEPLSGSKKSKSSTKKTKTTTTKTEESPSTKSRFAAFVAKFSGRRKNLPSPKKKDRDVVIRALPSRAPIFEGDYGDMPYDGYVHKSEDDQAKMVKELKKEIQKRLSRNALWRKILSIIAWSSVILALVISIPAWFLYFRLSLHISARRMDAIRVSQMIDLCPDCHSTTLHSPLFHDSDAGCRNITMPVGQKLSGTKWEDGDDDGTPVQYRKLEPEVKYDREPGEEIVKAKGGG